MSHKIRFFVAFLVTIFMAAFGLSADNGMMTKSGQSTETIVTVASDNPDFSTLITALKQADLTTVLEGQGPFTVFAPDNDAFSKLGDDTVNDLLKPENKEKLKEILLLHVVPGKVTSSEITKDMDVTTANGDDLQIQVSNGKITIDGNEVIKPDIDASNGVIHTINGVIIPKS